MNRINYRLVLDTHKSGVQQIIQGFQQYEILSRRLNISLKCGSEVFELPSSNIVATLYMTLPDGTTVLNRSCTIEGNDIVYDTQTAELAQKGLVMCQLVIAEALLHDGLTRVICSPYFALDVWDSEYIDIDVTQEYNFEALENALAQAQQAIDLQTGKAELATEMAESASLSAESSAESAQSALESKISASASASSASASATSASNSASQASTYATNASNSASQASTYATNAEVYAGNAKDSQDASAQFATKAESYAVGHTHSREGEDYDNAKYYKECCEASEEFVRQAYQVGNMSVNANGHLICAYSDYYNPSIDRDDGHLYLEVDNE